MEHTLFINLFVFFVYFFYLFSKLHNVLKILLPVDQINIYSEGQDFFRIIFLNFWIFKLFKNHFPEFCCQNTYLSGTSYLINYMMRKFLANPRCSCVISTICRANVEPNEVYVKLQIISNFFFKQRESLINGKESNFTLAFA